MCQYKEVFILIIYALCLFALPTIFPFQLSSFATQSIFLVQSWFKNERQSYLLSLFHKELFFQTIPTCSDEYQIERMCSRGERGYVCERVRGCGVVCDFFYFKLEFIDNTQMFEL